MKKTRRERGGYTNPNVMMNENSNLSPFELTEEAHHLLGGISFIVHPRIYRQVVAYLNQKANEVFEHDQTGSMGNANLQNANLPNDIRTRVIRLVEIFRQLGQENIGDFREFLNQLNGSLLEANFMEAQNGGRKRKQRKTRRRR